jgi:hypothetical protein
MLHSVSAWLAQLVAEQRLRTSIAVEASWYDIGQSDPQAAFFT